mmetsp:Transcript_96384/g.166141  ORF Transcript_96384/g.166141 Transcript_96384/m.166141 type:complete len:288 (-) Transcript_96384:2086-2949(-)
MWRRKGHVKWATAPASERFDLPSLQEYWYFVSKCRAAAWIPTAVCVLEPSTAVNNNANASALSPSTLIPLGCAALHKAAVFSIGTGTLENVTVCFGKYSCSLHATRWLANIAISSTIKVPSVSCSVSGLTFTGTSPNTGCCVNLKPTFRRRNISAPFGRRTLRMAVATANNCLMLSAMELKTCALAAGSTWIVASSAVAWPLRTLLTSRAGSTHHSRTIVLPIHSLRMAPSSVTVQSKEKVSRSPWSFRAHDSATCGGNRVTDLLGSTTDIPRSLASTSSSLPVATK